MRILIALMIFLMAAGLAQAQTAPTVAKAKGTKVNLDARASAEVDNDVMRARLFVEMEDTDTTRLADKVNRATNDSLKLASGFTGCGKRLRLQTYPVIDKEKSRAGLELGDPGRGRGLQVHGRAIGKMQAIMQSAVDFAVSTAARARRRGHSPDCHRGILAQAHKWRRDKATGVDVIEERYQPMRLHSAAPMRMSWQPARALRRGSSGRGPAASRLRQRLDPDSRQKNTASAKDTFPRPGRSRRGGSKLPYTSGEGGSRRNATSL